MDDLRFVYSIYIETTAEQLWQALTVGDLTQQYWYGRRIESDWKIGSLVVYWINYGQDIDMQGKVLVYDPPHKLSFSWCVTSEASITLEDFSRVTYDIEPLGSVVKCTVTHDGFKAGKPVPAGIRDGWPIIMCSLKTFLETKKPLSITIS
jgi:uncharacterized protein YndB with AHSA1/START domain